MGEEALGLGAANERAFTGSMKHLYSNLFRASALSLALCHGLTATEHGAPAAGASPDHAAGASRASAQGQAPAAAGVAPRKAVDQTMALIREASLALLKEGNTRYAAGQPRHPNQGEDRRAQAVAEGQKPFATILACSDSRSPVEVLFDRGVGELFVVRVAGNVADETQVATIEYGVEHLKTPLLVVLGHTGCGAVTAACQGGELPGHLHALIDRIAPAVTRAKAVTDIPEHLVPAAIQANVWQQIETVIGSSSIVREKLKEGALQIVGGIYDLQRGTVNWLGQHPSQEELIAQSEAAEKASAGRTARTAHTGDDAEDEITPPAAGRVTTPSPLPPASFSATSLLPSREVKARTAAPAKESDEHSPEPQHPVHH